MPKKTPGRAGSQGNNYAKINMPAAFLTPPYIQTSDGRTFEKCFVSLPKGTKVNGIDVSGFSTDVFSPTKHEEGHAWEGTRRVLVQEG